MSRLNQILLLFAGFCVVGVLFVPLWRIELSAPQYPEGLTLLIHPNKIAGNVDIVNGLNHYIGMKTLHTEDFPEFKLLPIIISIFAAAFFLTAFLRKKKIMTILFISFIAFGIIAMADFWKWEYDYGHNLNPDAAIIVPGMAYQPPLIGFKQLLNFGAYSVPDIGGWLFIIAGLTLSLCMFLSRKNSLISKVNPQVSVALLFILTFTSCTNDPQSFRLGMDNCTNCSMTITNPRFGAEIITKKGKVFKFDEIGCLLSYKRAGKIKNEDIAQYFSADYKNEGQLIRIDSAVLVKNELLRSPMGTNIAAFKSSIEAQDYIDGNGGEILNWNELIK